MPSCELWKDVTGYEGRYQVSDCGSVRSLPRPWRKQLLILKPGRDTDGYQQVALHKNGKRVTRKVHQLVLETFGATRLSKDDVTRHLDGNKDTNRIDNLKWGSVAENATDAVQHGTSPGFGSCGENNGQSKLTSDDVRRIRQLLRTGKYEQQKLASLFGVSKQTITFIKQGKTWKGIGEQNESGQNQDKG